MTGLKQRLSSPTRLRLSPPQGAGGLKSRLPGLPAAGARRRSAPAVGQARRRQPPPQPADGTRRPTQVVDAAAARRASATAASCAAGCATCAAPASSRFRDVGGLIFDMRRFGRDRPDLVEAKLAALGAVDQELRALERVLDDRRPIHELREPGLSSCPRCGALHASEDNFCPRCGLQFGGPQAMGEVGGAIAAPPQAPPRPSRSRRPRR